MTYSGGTSETNPLLRAPPDERELVLAFQRGEDGAYQAIYDRFSGRVHGLCRRMLTNPDDAKEAAQEAFLRVYTALIRFNGRYQLGPWITRITTNVCVDALRARGRRPEMIVLDELDSNGTNGNGNGDDGPEEIVLRNAESRRVRKVLAGLPPMHRAAIVLRDFEGLSYQEVADVLQISEVQVKALIHRARKSFKRSWVTQTLTALIPARLVQRARRVEAPAAEEAPRLASSATQATQAFASSPQFVACSTILQQCSHLVTERAGAVMTAMIFGTATAGAAVASGAATPPPVERNLESSAPVAAAGESEDPVGSPDEASEPADEPMPTEEPVVVPPGTQPPPPEEAPPPVEPQPSESPAPTPSESPSPSTGPENGTTPTGGDTSENPPPADPEPQGFTLSFATDLKADRGSCSCLKETKVESEAARFGGGTLEFFEQTLEGTATAAGAPSYGLWLQHSSDPTDYSASFRLHTEEGWYYYSASARLKERSATAWGGQVYRYEGTYRLSSMPTKDEAMPREGTYHAEVVVSERQSRVVELRIRVGS